MRGDKRLTVRKIKGCITCRDGAVTLMCTPALFQLLPVGPICLITFPSLYIPVCVWGGLNIMFITKFYGGHLVKVNTPTYST